MRDCLLSYGGQCQRNDTRHWSQASLCTYKQVHKSSWAHTHTVLPQFSEWLTGRCVPRDLVRFTFTLCLLSINIFSFNMIFGVLISFPLFLYFSLPNLFFIFIHECSKLWSYLLPHFPLQLLSYSNQSVHLPTSCFF